MKLSRPRTTKPAAEPQVENVMQFVTDEIGKIVADINAQRPQEPPQKPRRPRSRTPRGDHAHAA
jgi:hypothetical protein